MTCLLTHFLFLLDKRPLGRQALRSPYARGGDEGKGRSGSALHSGQTERLSLASRQVLVTAPRPLGAHAHHCSSLILNRPLCPLPEPPPKQDLSPVLRKPLCICMAFVCLTLVLVTSIVLQAVFCKSTGPWGSKPFCYSPWCLKSMTFQELS